MHFEITKSNRTHDVIQQVHQQISNVLRRQAEEIQRLAQNLNSLQNEQQQLEGRASQMLDHLESSLAGEASVAVAEVKAATGIRDAQGATEQAERDEAQVKPRQATPSPQFHLLGTSEIFSAKPAAPTKQSLALTPAAVSQAKQPPANPVAPNVTHSTEDEERTICDARRFSKLLVSKIELYNRNSVEEGHRNRDLYLRLKEHIERSRETYEKRFAHTVAKQYDHFHGELVMTLAENDPLLLGAGYPGPST
ncbi:MAG TPA: hypothetical protein VFZ27_02985 [Terriglobia bacterium]|nr:hypothetical protein [Terriglobia bacterium]